MTNYFLFDTETGGLKKESSLLTVFGYKLNEELKIIDEISYSVKAPMGVYVIEAKALEVNRINLVEHDRTATPIDEVKLGFKNSICKWNFGASKEKITPIGHNVRFDVKFMKTHIMPEWDMYFDRRHIDTASIAKFLFLAGVLPNLKNYSLSDIAKSLSIPIADESLHTAKGDVDLTLSVLLKFKELVRIQQQSNKEENT